MNLERLIEQIIASEIKIHCLCKWNINLLHITVLNFNIKTQEYHSRHCDMCGSHLTIGASEIIFSYGDGKIYISDKTNIYTLENIKNKVDKLRLLI